MSERKETLMRIVVAIISGIVLIAWRYFIIILVIINFFYSIFSNKRLKELADLSEVFNTQVYIYLRYLTFVTNKRPFPFTKIEKSISKFDKSI